MGSRNENTTSNSKETVKTGGPISWAMRLGSKVTGKAAAEKKPDANAPQQSSGVILPAGVPKESSNEGAIKFGSIEPEQIQNAGGKRPEQENGHEAKFTAAPKPPAEAKKAPAAPKHTNNRPIGPAPHVPHPPIGQSSFPQPSQQYPMPYGQPAYQVQAPYGGQPFMQTGQMFYGGNFRQPVAGYYGQPVMSPMAGPESVSPTSPQAMHGASTFTQAAKTTPPVREKRILRIEDPNTHEALDLNKISNRSQTKAPASDETSKAPASDDNNKAEQSAPKAEIPVQEAETKTEVKEEEQPESAKTPETEEKPAETEGQESKTTPEEVKESGPKKTADGRITYTNEFLLSLRAQCKSLPPFVEPATLSALFSKQSNNNNERGEWKGGNRGPPPPPRGRGPSRQNSRNGGADSDTWERGKPLPPHPYGGRGAPPPGMRMPSGPLPALHKSEAAYKLGKTTSEDPEEELTQKALKALLNKITPENFMIITEQIIAKINEKQKAKTLMGFINQIFDKALRETTFAELYADLVSKLNPALPDLTDEDGNPVNFRRALLNKCQEEFDYGVNAMKAVAERERRAEESQEQSDEEMDEKDMTDEDRSRIASKAEKKRLDKSAAESELVARRRMLANMIFVGQLYRFGILIEAVMHTCIRQLLEETENPRPEDVECLCKLLTTVGRPMDASTRDIKLPDGTSMKTNEMMGVYFSRIERLSKSEKLDARHRFMLKDLIDLRKNDWVERRKSEGPKKIGEIHREAEFERSQSQKLDRQSTRRGDRGPPRNNSFDNRVDAPIRTMSANKLGQDTNSLRPGGRPGPPKQPKQAPKPANMPEDVMERKTKGLLQELFHNQDPKEATIVMRELKDNGAKMTFVVDCVYTSCLEGKGTSWELVKTLFKSSIDEEIVSSRDMQQGTRSLLNKLEDIRVDVPKAPEQIGDLLSFLVNENCLDLEKLMVDIHEADMEPAPEGEDTMMVDSGTAKDLVGVFLKGLKSLKEEGELSSQLKCIKLEKYFPSYERDDPEQISLFKQKYDIEDLL